MNRVFTILLIIIVTAVAVGIFWLGDREDAHSSSKLQTPQPPYSYDVEAFTIPGSENGVILDGTLTLPAGDGPFPTAILLSVAGPNDRDQSFAGHAGFHVLADHLTRNGIAVARFDDRGVGDSTGDYFDASWDDLSRDALDVVSYLQTNPRIDASRIGFAGMSQGGAIGALAASKSDHVAFLILISAPGLTGKKALELQLDATLAISGIEGETAETYRSLFGEFVDIVKSDPDDPETHNRMRTFLRGPGKSLIPPYRFVPKDIEGRVSMFLGPWYRSNVNFDPVAAYGPLKVPVLAIGGDKDFVAPPAQHLMNIETIFRPAPTSDTTIEMVSGLNHLMQEAKTGLPTEYASLENTFSPAALDIITDWVNVRFGSSQTFE